MKIAIIDADLIYKKYNKMPNLACMKISGYYKAKGHECILKLDYNDLEAYDKVFISKVFTDTEIDEDVLKLNNVECGGTGFFFDKAPNLPDDIEHHMPDYHLYDNWVNESIYNGMEPSKLLYYTKCSIGFTTRGCFRKCWFCVNKKYDHAFIHSPVSEFLDVSRKYIVLLDDNVLACSEWKNIFETLIATGKRIQFNQGLDERLLTDEKCDFVFNKLKYFGDYIFAFDNYLDKDIIQSKIDIIKKHYTNKRRIRFYVFCGSPNPEREYNNFYLDDIIDIFERIKILGNAGFIPYIMRHIDYNNSPYRDMYVAIAGWCNQHHLFTKFTFREFCIGHGMTPNVYKKYKNNPRQYLEDGYKKHSTWNYLDTFENRHPEIAEKYFDLRFDI